MARHLRGSTWLFFKENIFRGTGRLLQGQVRTESKSTINVDLLFPSGYRSGWVMGDDGVRLILHREDARMLARRLNQCLEASA